MGLAPPVSFILILHVGGIHVEAHHCDSRCSCLPAGGIWWLYDGKRRLSISLTLYGNVDIRQVDVGFRVGGRVTELFKEEGDAVKTGERLARLDAKPYEEVFDRRRPAFPCRKSN